MKTVPRCSDCRHSRVMMTDIIERLPSRCVSPKTDPIMCFTETVRVDNRIVARIMGTCGAEGRFFESRYKPVPIRPRNSAWKDWAFIITRFALAFVIIFGIIYSGMLLQ